MWMRKQSTLPSEATSTVRNSTTRGGDPSDGILRTWTVGVRMAGSVGAMVLPVSQLNGPRRIEMRPSMLSRVNSIDRENDGTA